MLKFYELAPSPNNIKVRLALAYKGVPFELVPVDPRDRSKVVELTGQELTPAIADNGIVLNDSEAILHYLDANYRDTPRLFPQKREGRKAADRWHRWLEKSIGKAWTDIFFAAIKRTDGHAEESPRIYADVLRELDEKLDDRTSFHDDTEMVICDLRVAQFACYGLPGDGLIERCRLFRRFAECYGVERGAYSSLEKMLEPWNNRLA